MPALQQEQRVVLGLGQATIEQGSILCSLRCLHAPSKVAQHSVHGIHATIITTDCVITICFTRSTNVPGPYRSAVVGGVPVRRRHRDQRPDRHRDPRDELPGQPLVPAARARLHPGQGRGRLLHAAPLLRRRDDHRLRLPGQAVRDEHPDHRGGHLPDHPSDGRRDPSAGRRDPPEGDPRRAGRGPLLLRDHGDPLRGHDPLHLHRRHHGRGVGGRGADAALRGRRADRDHHRGLVDRHRLAGRGGRGRQDPGPRVVRQPAQRR